MKELNFLKTYNYFYTPKAISYFSDDKRNELLEKSVKQKIFSQKGQIIPINTNIKNNNKKIINEINKNLRNNHMPILLNNNTNGAGTPNRNYYLQNNKISNISNSSYRSKNPLPSMLNNYMKINEKKHPHYKSGLSYNYPKNKFYYYNQPTNLKIQTPKSNNLMKYISNNYLNIYNYNIINNINNMNNNKENMESVEWMLYNKKKNKNKNNKNDNNMDVLDDIFNLKKYEEFLQINTNIPPLLEVNNYNFQNEPKKKNSKDNLLYGHNINNNKKRKSFEIKVNIEKDNNLLYNNKNIKKRKLIKYDILSIPGSHNGVEKINKDCFLILPKINGCNNVKIFGVFDGHGTYGDKISQEICQYFNSFFNNKEIYEQSIDNLDNKENDIISEIIKNMKRKNKINIKKHKKGKSKEKELNNLILNNKTEFNIRDKFKQLTPDSSKKNSILFSRFKKIKDIFNDKFLKNIKIKNIYNNLSTNNYLQIYNSFKSIDNILHEKYTENKICDGSGTSLSYILIFNDYYSNISNNSENYNKIISTNLGNTKTILINEDKKIKELNICHTPCIKEERIRIEKNGGKIDRIDWLKVGPLRVWFKDKKYPGLSITRSLGDFEAESLGILSIPDIKEFDIDEEKTKIIIMGTNGIWEFLTNEKIMDIVWSYYEWNDVEGATQKIIETAGKLWKIKNPKNIPDLTVGVLFFK